MGWAECRIRVDAAAATVTASYLSDALGDLCSGVIALLRGEAQARVSFEEEPREYRWLFARSGQDRLRIRILEFEDAMDDAPDEDGQTIFDAECMLRAFAAVLLTELERVLTEYGLAGYKEQWVLAEFPESRLFELRALLGDAASASAQVGA
jgi:hypothetical protein